MKVSIPVWSAMGVSFSLAETVPLTGAWTPPTKFELYPTLKAVKTTTKLPAGRLSE